MSAFRQFNKFVKEEFAQSKTERPPPVATPESAATGTRVGGTAFSGTTPGGSDVDILSGAAEVGPDGSASGKGAVAKLTNKDQDDTTTIGEVEVAPGKASAVGAKREIDIAKKLGVLPPGTVVKADVVVGSASAEKRVFDDGAAVGLEASGVAGSLTAGSSGTKKADGSDSDRDETLRVGLSAGPGAAARIHFSDDDHDGNPEIGVGVDFEFISIDVKSEDPLRTAGALLNPGILPSIGRAIDDDGSNLTKKAAGLLGLPEEGTLKKGVDIFKKLAGVDGGQPPNQDPGAGNPGVPPTPDITPVRADPPDRGTTTPECGDPQHGGDAAAGYAAPPEGSGPATGYAAPPEGGGPAAGYAAPPEGSGPATGYAAPPEGGGPAAGYAATQEGGAGATGYVAPPEGGGT